MGDGVTFESVPIGSCGPYALFSPYRSLEAYVYLTENYACDGKLTVQDFYQAIEDGHWDEVAYFVFGSWQDCQKGDRCSIELEDVKFDEPYNTISKTPPLNVKRFAPTFELAIRNGLALPSQGFDFIFEFEREIRHLFNYFSGTCGLAVASLPPNNFHFKNYGTITLTLKNRATPKDLKHIQQAVTKFLGELAKKPIDPNRVEVTDGPNQRRVIYDLDFQDVNGQYRAHKAIVPTVQIKILPPQGCGAGLPSS